MKHLTLLLFPLIVACTTTTTKPDGTIVVTGPDGKATAVIVGAITKIADDVIVLQQTKSQQAVPPLPVLTK